MEGVRAVDAGKKAAQTGLERRLAFAPVRYALYGCGGLFALLNAARIAFMFISPAACR
jgi:hypothetical protein